MITIFHTEPHLQTELASESQLTSLPTQRQLLLPLLETLHESGGQAKPSEVYESLATKIQLPQWLRHLRTLAGRAGEINVWERRVRNTRQQAADTLTSLRVNRSNYLPPPTTAGFVHLK